VRRGWFHGGANDFGGSGRRYGIEALDIGDAMAHELVAARFRGVGDLGIEAADRAVERDGVRDAALGKNVEQTPDRDAQSVIVARQVADIHAAVVVVHVPVLDVRDEMHRDARAVRPCEPRALRHRRIIVKDAARPDGSGGWGPVAMSALPVLLLRAVGPPLLSRSARRRLRFPPATRCVAIGSNPFHQPWPAPFSMA
jgi:hypothetical protein